MALSDTIGDLITRIRNGQQARKSEITTPHSKLRANVLDVLKREGYIRDYQEADVRTGIKEIKVSLKYYEGAPVIKKIKRVSRPGCRSYTAIADCQKVHNGLGISILTTPKGVLSDAEARAQNVGGEILCEVF